MARIIMVLAVVASLVSPAAADPDPDVGLGLSAGGTAVSIGLIAAGHWIPKTRDVDDAGALSLLVTPSAGRWYAGDGVTGGFVMRAVSAGAIVGGFVYVFKRCFNGCMSDADNVVADGLVFGGLAGFAAGTVYDIYMAPRSARDHAATQTKILPTVFTQRSTSVPGSRSCTSSDGGA